MRRFLLCLLLVPGVALAQTFTLPGQTFSVSELSQARGIGMGGAFRGLGMTSDAVLGNPAALSMMKAYQVELGGAWDPATKDGYVAVTLRDSATAEVAAGIGYQFLKVGRGENARTGHLSTLGLSIAVAQWMLLGVNARYYNQSGASRVNAGTMDTGLAIRPTGGLVIGVSAHNLIDTKNPELLRYYSAQLGWISKSFTLALDVRSTLSGVDGAPRLNLGGEYVIGNVVPIRAGYGHDFLSSQNFASAGLGFQGEVASVDLAYRHEFGGTESRVLSLGLRVQL